MALSKKTCLQRVLDVESRKTEEYKKRDKIS